MPRKKKQEQVKEKENDKKLEKKIEKKEKKEEEKIEEKIEKKEDKKIDELEVKDFEKIEKEGLLVPVEYYIQAAVHLGTRAVTPDMREYVYKRRADGIAILNTKKVDDKIIIAAEFLAQFETEKIVFCCKRENCERIVELFGKITGIKTFTKYPAGIITNPSLVNFFEPEVMFISDPWLDKNALRDAVIAKIPILSLCSTNNLTRYVDIVVPCNNKSSKSIGLILYLIAKVFLEKKGIKKEIPIKDFFEVEEKKDLDLEEARKLVRKKLEEIKKKRREGL